MDTSLFIVGIDIAKAKFDVALLLNDKYKTKVFTNTSDGFKEFLKWLQYHGVEKARIGMEATGIYGESLADFLHDKGFQVSVINPAQISAYGKSQLQRGKTDEIDARLIARFCEREQPEIWQPQPLEQRQLLQLARQLQHLSDCLLSEKNRLDTTSSIVQPTIQALIAFLEAQIKSVSEDLDRHINQHPTLKSNRKLLESIPGVGVKTSPWLLAYLGDGLRFGRGKQAAAYAGLSPKPFQSGSSVKGKTRISKTGQADLRKMLFMPALATYGHKKSYLPFVARLKENGKCPMAIIIALMRKIITIAQAVLKSQKPFEVRFHAV